MIVGSGANEPAISEGDKHSAIERVTASQALARADQLKSFLEFVCEYEMRGEGAALNEYLIGVQVLGRPEGYSTADDAAVRTRAHTLRRKLLDYYLIENPSDPIRIELPKGSYCPHFSRAVPPTVHPALPPLRTRVFFLAGVGLLFLIGSVLGAYQFGRLAASPEIPQVLRDAWGPLLRPDGNVLVCLATPFHLLIRSGPPEAEGRLYRPIPDLPEIAAWYRERHELPAGQRLFMNSGHNSPMFGDVAAMISATRLLGQAGVSYEVMPERVVAPFALRNRNVIVLGRPEYSRAATILLEKGWFGVSYYGPANGATVWYPNPTRSQPAFYQDPKRRFGLITVLPSDGERETLHRTIVISGATSASAHAAAEFLTSPTLMQSLADRFRREGLPAWPKAWQVVVSTGDNQMLPFDVTYHAHRVLAK